MNVKKVLVIAISTCLKIILLIVIVFFALRLSENAYEFGHSVYTAPALEEAPGTDISVLIKENMSNYEIGEALKEVGLIEDEKLFYAQIKLSKYDGKIPAGVYVLNTSMTARDMMAVMSGETIDVPVDADDAAGVDNTSGADDAAGVGNASGAEDAASGAADTGDTPETGDADGTASEE